MRDDPSEIERQQAELRSDAALIHEYGQLHSHDWVGSKFDNEPNVQLVVGFAHRVRHHEEQLRRMVRHPDRLTVVPLPMSSEELQEQQTALQRELERLPDGPLRSIVITWGMLQIWLSPYAETLAHTLYQRFGDTVDIRVGALIYPPHRAATPMSPPPTPQIAAYDGLVSELRLDTDTLTAGRVAFGRVFLRNIGREHLYLKGESPALASLWDMGSGRLVGVFNGGFALMPLVIDLEVGQESSVATIIGTDSADAHLGYVLPPGAYVARATIAISMASQGLAIAVPGKIVQVRHDAG
jgi:hypothetical protein